MDDKRIRINGKARDVLPKAMIDNDIARVMGFEDDLANMTEEQQHVAIILHLKATIHMFQRLRGLAKKDMGGMVLFTVGVEDMKSDPDMSGMMVASVCTDDFTENGRSIVHSMAMVQGAERLGVIIAEKQSRALQSRRDSASDANEAEKNKEQARIEALAHAAARINNGEDPETVLPPGATQHFAHADCLTCEGAATCDYKDKVPAIQTAIQDYYFKKAKESDNPEALPAFYSMFPMYGKPAN